MTALPRIAIATGDPAGIGPEISLKAALDPGIHALCRPIIVGDPAVLDAHAKASGLAPNIRLIGAIAEADWSDNAVNVLTATSGDNIALRFGTIDPAYGRASLASARRAIQAALANEVDAVRKDSASPCGSMKTTHGIVDSPRKPPSESLDVTYHSSTH